MTGRDEQIDGQLELFDTEKRPPEAVQRLRELFGVPERAPAGEEDDVDAR